MIGSCLDHLTQLWGGIHYYAMIMMSWVTPGEDLLPISLNGIHLKDYPLGQVPKINSPQEFMRCETSNVLQKLSLADSIDNPRNK